MSKRKGNDVFKGSEGGSQAEGWAGPTSNILEDDFGLKIPVELVPLPSKGLIYPEGHPLHMKEAVEITAMTAKEEDILTNRVFIKKKTVITELLRSSLVDKRIDPSEMIAGDRNAIMTALRITGYGAEYNVTVSCPACGADSKQEFDLAQLPINTLGQEPVAIGANLFEFELPMTKKKVRFKYLTGYDENEMATIEERLRKKGIENGNTVTARFQHQVMQIDNIDNKAKIQKFCMAMPARDSLALRKFMDKCEPGIDMKAYMSCPHCLEESEVRMPLGASFFWPDE